MRRIDGCEVFKKKLILTISVFKESLTCSAFAIEAALSAVNLVLLIFNSCNELLFLMTSAKALPPSVSKPLYDKFNFLIRTFSFCLNNKFFKYTF